MSIEEHLYENVACFVQEHGWEKFPDYLSAGEAGKFRKEIPCSEYVDDMTLAHLIGLARYMVYQATTTNEDWKSD